MNKYLVLDDGENIKAYDESQKSYVTIGILPVTKEMFELYGNDTVNTSREGLIVVNPKLLYYSFEDKDLKYKAKAIPQNQIININKSFLVDVEKGIKNISFNYKISGKGSIKCLVASGKNYYGMDNSYNWINVSSESVDDFEKYGISLSRFISITEAKYREIFNTNNNLISFKFLLSKSNVEDVCSINDIQIKYI